MMTATFGGAPAFVSVRLLLLLTLPFGPAALSVVELASSPVGEVLASFVVYALFAANSVVWAFAGAALIRPARRFAARRWLQRFVAAGLVLVPLALVWQREHLRAEVRADWPRFEQRFSSLDGLTEAEVVARLGPPDDTDEDHWGEEDQGEWIAYEHEREVYRSGRVILRLDEGRVASVEFVPGFDIPFEPEDWRRSGPERRKYMADDLVDCGELIGCSPAEVRSLLGPEDLERYRSHGGELSYPLGWRGLFFDRLNVYLDDGGRVSEVRLVRADR